MYKLTPLDIFSNTQKNVIRLLDNAVIPFEPANTDYQVYLTWLEEGNTPLPAEDNTYWQAFYLMEIHRVP